MRYHRCVKELMGVDMSWIGTGKSRIDDEKYVK